jgi:hypothetical protein
MFAKIVDNDNLVRDCNTNAILATDRTALMLNRAQRKAAHKSQQEIAELKDQVAKLTTLVEQLLQQPINSQNTKD